MSIRIVLVSMVLPLCMAAQTSDKAPVQGMMILQAGVASAFSLPLADFGQSPAQQDLAVFKFSNLLKNDDGLTVYGWQTVGANRVIDWDSGIGYRLPVARLGKSLVSVSTSAKKWYLPSVAHTDDWVMDSSVYYERSGSIPILFETNIKTVVASNQEFAKGSFIQFIAETSRPLLKTHGATLTLRHGPTYVYGLGMYGVRGNRLFRYGGALSLSYHSFNFDFQGRTQIALQPGIRNSMYWGVSVTRVFGIFGRA